MEKDKYVLFKAGDTIPKSKYKGVYARLQRSRYITWVAEKKNKGKKYRKVCKTEKQAALAYDKMCLSFGLPPVNILVKKK